MLTILRFLLMTIPALLLSLFAGREGGSENPALSWEYREIMFPEPVSFATNVSDGYMVNGQLMQPDSEVRVMGVFNSLGRQGWELVSASADSRSYIFKRPIL